MCVPFVFITWVAHTSGASAPCVGTTRHTTQRFPMCCPNLFCTYVFGCDE